MDFQTISNSINYGSFDIKCKKLNVKKTSGNIFLGHLGESSSDFPNPALDHGGAPNTFQNFHGSCYKI